MRYYYIILLFFILFILFFYNNEIYVCRKKIRVIDGDTFYLDGIKIRIYGIDALELHKQKEYVLDRIKKKNLTCLKYYAYLAKIELDKILRKYCIKIKIIRKDKYGRVLAKVYNCSDSSCTDIGRYFVLNGLALSFFDAYKNEEIIAKNNKKGFWRCN